jgi:DNA-binding beta-propeller fold protein YncE
VVANRAGSVSLFDLATTTEVARLPIGLSIPHEVAVSPDGRRALSSEYGSDTRRGRRLVVIDVAEARIAGYVDLGAGSRPHDMRFLPDGRRAVVTMQDSDRIALVDTDALAVLRTFPTGGREGHMVQVSPDGATAYVTSRGAEGTLSVINLNGDTAPLVIPTGGGAEGIAVTAGSAAVWVANRQAESISIVDAARREVVDSLDAVPFASRMTASPRGVVAVINGLTGTEADGRLRLYEAGTRRLLHDLEVPGDHPNERGRGVAFDGAGDQLFLSTEEADAIFVYDMGDPTAPPRLITTGHDQPDGLAWSPLRVGVFEE